MLDALYVPKLTTIQKVLLFTTVLTSVFLLTSARAHAATLTVATGNDETTTNSSCSLSEAIDNINDQAQTHPDCAAGDGNNDTISIPAGTITLTADLPEFTESASVVGAGRGVSTIDVDGFVSFYGAGHSFAYKDFTIENASDYAIRTGNSVEAVLENMEVANSGYGADISAKTIEITGSIIRNNVAPGSILSGIRTTLFSSSSGDTPSLTVENSKIVNNTGERTGLWISKSFGGTPPASVTVSMYEVEISGNTGELMAGINIDPSDDGVALSMSISSTTIANNSVVATVDRTDASPLNNPRVSGVVGNLIGLQAGNHLYNVTIADNTITNNIDNQVGIAGFFVMSVDATAALSQINTTVVGNTVTHPGLDLAVGGLPAFSFLNIDTAVPTVTPGGSVQNSLVAANTYNGQTLSCRNDFPLSPFGMSGTIDATPLNNGDNITDDHNCTGYGYSGNIISTLGPLQNNGGNVPTRALLAGSPAINTGGHVLGITTDARGIARPTDCPSVGAYQYEGAVCGASTTSGGAAGGNSSLGNTGQNSKAILAALGLTVSAGLALCFARKRPSYRR